MKLKRCRITNCPGVIKAYDTYYCNDTMNECCDVDCIWKQILLKPRSRIEYVKNKLQTCYGYSPQEKKIRYEELDWVIKECCDSLDIEVLENGTWTLVKKPVEQKR